MISIGVDKAHFVFPIMTTVPSYYVCLLTRRMLAPDCYSDNTKVANSIEVVTDPSTLVISSLRRKRWTQSLIIGEFICINTANEFKSQWKRKSRKSIHRLLKGIELAILYNKSSHPPPLTICFPSSEIGGIGASDVQRLFDNKNRKTTASSSS